MNRSTSTSSPSINEATKLAAIHRPVVMQRKVPQIRTVLKTVEIPPAKFVDRVVDGPEPCRVMTAVKSSIFDGLMAKLRQESSLWMDDLANSSWRQDKSARKWARYRGWRKVGHDSWSWAGNGWSWRE